jgi:UDP-N-acetylmuramoyl-L-alanyl-D-glutamate--2,6-diaminopimelate ligase
LQGAVICDTFPENIAKGVTYVQVRYEFSLAFMAANYYGDPSQNLKLVGITGTKRLSLLYYISYLKAGFKVGLLSTVKIMVDTVEYKATHTTPDSITINQYLNEMVENGVEYCFMEVSSHGIQFKKRTEALHFVGGIFVSRSFGLSPHVCRI